MNDSPERDDWIEEVMDELDARSGSPSERESLILLWAIVVVGVLMFVLAIIGAITVIGWLT